MDLNTLNAALSLLYPILTVFVAFGVMYFIYYVVKKAIEKKIQEEIQKTRKIYVC